MRIYDTGYLQSFNVYNYSAYYRFRIIIFPSCLSSFTFDRQRRDGGQRMMSGNVTDQSWIDSISSLQDGRPVSLSVRENPYVLCLVSSSRFLQCCLKTVTVFVNFFVLFLLCLFDNTPTSFFYFFLSFRVGHLPVPFYLPLL